MGCIVKVICYLIYRHSGGSRNPVFNYFWMPDQVRHDSSGKVHLCESVYQVDYSKSNKKTRQFLLSKSGFTLLETMVAVCIIAIVLVSVYKLQAQTIVMNIDAKFYTTAPFLAQSKLTEIELSPLSELADSSGDFGEEFSGYSYTISVGDIETEALGEIANRVKRIDVTVSYNNDEFTYQLRAYKLMRE